jgi:hypothetical protein
VLNHVARVSFSVRSLLDVFVATTSSPFPTAECGSGIYAMRCVCGATYVGRTLRSFGTRVDEHHTCIGSMVPAVMRQNGPGFHIVEGDARPHLFPYHHLVLSTTFTRNSKYLQGCLESLCASWFPPSLLVNVRFGSFHADAGNPFRSLTPIHGGWRIMERRHGRDPTILTPTMLALPRPLRNIPLRRNRDDEQ